MWYIVIKFTDAKTLRDFLGYAISKKKVGSFLGRHTLKLGFLGYTIKYEPLSETPAPDHPPPIIKICEWGP